MGTGGPSRHPLDDGATAIGHAERALDEALEWTTATTVEVVMCVAGE
jgi:hypothetical protein